MRVVFYTRPCYLDAILSAIPYLADRVELHLIVELSPDQWETALFDIPRQNLRTGIIPGPSLLRPYFPSAAIASFQKLSSFNFIVHHQKKSLHPDTLIANNRVIAFIKKISPDIVHFDDLSLRMSLSLYRLRRSRIVLSIHDPIFHEGENTWRDYLSRKLAFRWVNKFILHNQSQKKDFISRYRILTEKVRSIPLGIYTVYRYWHNAEITQKTNTVLCFGRLSRYKGIRTLFQAARQVAAKISGVQFIIAGRQERHYALPAKPSLPNGGSIHLYDTYISNHHAAELFQAATVVVCPYHEATQSGVILTSYAFNRPVIATWAGGLQEYVVDGQSGLIVEPQNAIQLANAIISILADRHKQHQLKTGIRKIGARKLNWGQLSMQTVDLYSELTSITP